MNKPSPAYLEGHDAGSRSGKFAAQDADIRCPYVTETPEATDWQRGFDIGNAEYQRSSTPKK